MSVLPGARMRQVMSRAATGHDRVVAIERTRLKLRAHPDPTEVGRNADNGGDAGLARSPGNVSLVARFGDAVGGVGRRWRMLVVMVLVTPAVFIAGPSQALAQALGTTVSGKGTASDPYLNEVLAPSMGDNGTDPPTSNQSPCFGWIGFSTSGRSYTGDDVEHNGYVGCTSMFFEDGAFSTGATPSAGLTEDIEGTNVLNAELSWDSEEGCTAGSNSPLSNGFGVYCSVTGDTGYESFPDSTIKVQQQVEFELPTGTVEDDLAGKYYKFEWAGNTPICSVESGGPNASCYITGSWTAPVSPTTSENVQNDWS
jgi:hypothetical protein